jgi:hypothetical protein
MFFSTVGYRQVDYWLSQISTQKKTELDVWAVVRPAVLSSSNNPKKRAKCSLFPWQVQDCACFKFLSRPSSSEENGPRPESPCQQQGLLGPRTAGKRGGSDEISPGPLLDGARLGQLAPGKQDLCDPGLRQLTIPKNTPESRFTNSGIPEKGLPNEPPEAVDLLCGTV